MVCYIIHKPHPLCCWSITSPTTWRRLLDESWKVLKIRKPSPVPLFHLFYGNGRNGSRVKTWSSFTFLPSDEEESVKLCQTSLTVSITTKSDFRIAPVLSGICSFSSVWSVFPFTFYPAKQGWLQMKGGFFLYVFSHKLVFNFKRPSTFSQPRTPSIAVLFRCHLNSQPILST